MDANVFDIIKRKVAPGDQFVVDTPNGCLLKLVSKRVTLRVVGNNDQLTVEVADRDAVNEDNAEGSDEQDEDGVVVPTQPPTV